MPKEFISSAGLSSAKEPRLVPQKKLSAILATVAEFLVLAAIVLVPLSFLASTSQSLEFPKQIALLALVSLAALCWLGSMLVSKTLSLRRTVANPVVLILLGAVLLSALFSSAKYVGIIGDGGQEYQSLVTTLLFTALFFVTVNIPTRRLFASHAVFIATIVGGVASLYAIFQFADVHIIPAVTSTSFNLIGSTVVLGLFAATTLVMAAASFLTEVEGKFALAKRIAVGAAGACALFIVVIIDFWPIWVATIIGLAAIMAFAVVRPHAIRRLGWLGVPMVVMVIAVLMVVINAPLPIRAPSEVFPSLSQSFSVARASLFKNPILGSGPGTFAQDFAMYRTIDLNKSPLWYVQFDRGSSYLSTVAATLGLAGLVAWLAVIVIGVWKSIVFLIASRKKDDENWVLALVISAAWLVSAAGLVFYGTSVAALFLFWLLFAILIRSTSVENVEVTFDSSPRSGLVMTFAFVIIIVLALAGWFVSGTRLYADVAFVNGMTGNTDTQIDRVISDMEKAVTMNPQSDSIARNLSQAYLLKIQKVLNDNSIDATARGKQVQALTSSAVRAAGAAASLSPANAQNWAQLGAIYEAISSYVGGAPDQAIDAYGKAANLDPTSPVHPTAIGRVQMLVAGLNINDSTNSKDEAVKAAAKKKVDESLTNALESFGKALKLKSDYAPAIYQTALVYDAQGKTKDAISSLEKNQLDNSNDIGVGFELASLYYRDGQKPKAQSLLENMVKTSPNYANGRWFLATIYEEQSKWDDAIAQIEAVQKTNSDSDAVKQRLQDLQDKKAGKTPASTTSPTLP
jgi:tetratricopeptide (TPR) repeat protein